MLEASPKNHLLHYCITRHLERGNGDEAALLAREGSVSYAELAAVAKRGAAELDTRFAPGSRILIAARDQLHVGLGLVAALGSHSVPLLVDPTSPERLRRLAEDWQVSGAIAEESLRTGIGLPVLEARETERWLSEASPREMLDPPSVRLDEPAFWTFTSGSTGEPRAVLHAHRGPRAAFEAFARNVLRLGPEDVTIATAGLPFVYALGNNFFFPLMAGGAAIVPSDLLLPTVLGDLARHRATVLVSGPWSLSAMARLARRMEWDRALCDLRLVLSAGEPLPAGVFLAWKRRFGQELIDNLGCTEMFNSFLSNFPGDARPGSLGRVVPGYEVCVGERNPASGCHGALRVRGDSRAVGTGERGGRSIVAPADEWCETGDEVALDGEGRFVFLGRCDDRFKVKGQFVHPLEIERCFLEVRGVRECMAFPDVDENGVTIVAMKVVAVGAMDAAELRRRIQRHARQHLKPFQVPVKIEIVVSLPRSTRGKLERPSAAAT